MADDLKVTTTLGADLSQFKQAIGTDAPSIMATSMNQMAASVKELTTAIESMGQKSRAAMNSGRDATKEFESELKSTRLEMTESTHAISELGQMTGVHVPRMIARFISSIEGIAPLMAAAFAPIAILGVIELLGKAIDKIKEFADKAEADKEALDALKVSAIELDRSIVEGTEKTEEALIRATKGPIAEMDYKLAHIGDNSKEGFDKIMNYSKEATKQLLDDQTAVSKAFQDFGLEEGPEEMFKRIQSEANKARVEAIAAEEAHPTGRPVLGPTGEPMKDESGTIIRMRDSAVGYNAAWQEIHRNTILEQDAMDDIARRGFPTGEIDEYNRHFEKRAWLWQQETRLSGESHNAVKNDENEATTNFITKNNDKLKSDEATAAASHALNEEKFAREKAQAEQSLALHNTNNQQEVTQLKDINNKKLTADITYLNEKISIEKQRQGVSDNDRKAAITSLQSQQKVAREKTAADNEALDAAEAKRESDASDALEKQRISNAQREGVARVSAAEDATKKDYELHHITLEKETEDLKAEAKDRAQVELDALTATRNLEVANAAGDQQKIAAIDEKFASDKKLLEMRTQKEITDIDSNAERIRQQNRKVIEQETAAFSKQMADLAASYDKQQNTFKLAMGRETQLQWYNEEVAIIKERYAAEEASLQAQLNEIKAVYGEFSPQYQKAQDQMSVMERRRVNESAQLANQMAMKWHQQMQAITSSFTSATNEWLTGQKTFMQSLASLWSTTLLAIIDKALQKMVMSFLTSNTVMEAAQKLHLGVMVTAKQTADATETASNAAKNQGIAFMDAFSASEGVTTTTVAAGEKEAVETESTEKSVFKSAKSGAARAYDALSAFPPLAVVAAAATFAAIMAVGAFEKGGIQPKTGLALVHQNEMVLPANISQPLQALLTGTPGLATASGGTFSETFGGGGREGNAFQPILNINAVDSQSIRRMLDTHGDVIGDYVYKHIQRRITQGGLRGKLKR
jgi:hypothetical protein